MAPLQQMAATEKGPDEEETSLKGADSSSSSEEGDHEAVPEVVSEKDLQLDALPIHVLQKLAYSKGVDIAGCVEKDEILRCISLNSNTTAEPCPNPVRLEIILSSDDEDCFEEAETPVVKLDHDDDGAQEYSCPNCERSFATHAAMSGHKRYCKPGNPLIPRGVGEIAALVTENQELRKTKTRNDSESPRMLYSR